MEQAADKLIEIGKIMLKEL